MAILQVMSYDSYPFDGEKNFITHPQNGLERHLSGLHRTYWQKSYYLLINDYNQSLSVKTFTSEGEIKENYQFQLQLTNQFETNDVNRLQQIIELIMHECQIQVVHFHFQKPIILQMIPLLKKFEQVKLLQTMHDLSYACGSYYEDYSYVVPTQVEQTINQLNQIIFPDDSVEHIYRQQMAITIPTQVIAHGVDMEKISPENTEQAEFKVLFLGALGKEKGGDLVAEIIKTELPNVSWHLLGRLESDALHTSEKYHYHGTYTSYDLTKKLGTIQPDLIVLPSQMIETFSYNLADSLAAGIPVLVPKKGAFLRIEGSQVGWFVEGEQSAEKYLEKIIQISGNLSDYAQKKAAAKHLQVKTVEQMNQEYASYYLAATVFDGENKSQLVAQTLSYEKSQYWQLVQTHQAYLQEKQNAEEHLHNYGLLAAQYQQNNQAYQELLASHQALQATHQETLVAHQTLASNYEQLLHDNQQQSNQIQEFETLLSRRIVGKINHYLLKKDSISKK